MRLKKIYQHQQIDEHKLEGKIMDLVIKAALVQAVFQETKSLYVGKPVAMDLLSIGETKFEEMRRLGLVPKETRLPSPTGTGKLLYHICDIVDFQMEVQ